MITPRRRTRRLTQLWWAVWAACWLCRVPILLRWRPLPVLLAHLTPAQRRRQGRHPLALDDAVRLCRLRLCRGSVFPRACLRQALTLYYVLTRLGYAVEIHFGIRKERDVLYGHSWVTMQGHPVAESRRTAEFMVAYSDPASFHPTGCQTVHPTCQGAWSALEVGVWSPQQYQ